MKCYLINLERSKERLSWFTQQSRDLGLKVDRVDAIDGRLLEVSEIGRITEQSSGLYAVEPGAIGCYLSHRKAWSTVANHDDAWAFICEDDLHLSKVFAAFCEETTWIPTNAEIVKADTSTEKRIEVAYTPTGVFQSRKIQQLRSVHRGTAGYFISRDAARKLLSLTEQRYDPVDELIFNPTLGIASQLNIYQINPAVCIQDAKASDKLGFQSDIPGGSSSTAKPVWLDKFLREIKRAADTIRKLFLRYTRTSEFLRIPFE